MKHLDDIPQQLSNTLFSTIIFTLLCEMEYLKPTHGTQVHFQGHTGISSLFNNELNSLCSDLFISNGLCLLNLTTHTGQVNFLI